ncbi:hypothetical protein ACFHW2_36330 [Actinomadura sp. LOL_016]
MAGAGAVSGPSRETARLLAAARTALGDAFPAAHRSGRTHPPVETAAGR